MKKKYNYLLALAVFLVIMICFNKFGYIISYLAAIGGSLVMGNNGTMVVYEFLMSHLNLVSAILYLMVLPIPALWYYLAFQLREGGIRAIPGKCRRVGLEGCVLIVLFTFGMIHVTSIILAIVAQVLPDATVKIYLTASAKERAKRRYLELQEKGMPGELDQIEADIIERDNRDMNREISPLRQAEDAVLVDASFMGIEEVTAAVIAEFEKKKQA